MIKKLKDLINVFSISEKRKFYQLQLLVLIMSVFQIVSVASFAPFLSIISDLEVFFTSSLSRFFVGIDEEEDDDETSAATSRSTGAAGVDNPNGGGGGTKERFPLLLLTSNSLPILTVSYEFTTTTVKCSVGAGAPG